MTELTKQPTIEQALHEEYTEVVDEIDKLRNQRAIINSGLRVLVAREVVLRRAVAVFDRAKGNGAKP